MSLLNYWPTAEEVNLCVNKEAEGAHDAVLLAVHQPTPMSYRLISNDLTYETSEDELFKYLISEDVPTGAHVMPITGASGVGKSHMVRLLAARLQSINVDGRYVIIRIPKSASLRRVVELILNELTGDEYTEVRTSFSKAVSEVNIESAAISFQGELNIALNELAKDLRTKIGLNSSSAELKEQYGHAINLPKFMGDAALVDYFHSKVFPRIVKRAVSGQEVSDFKDSDEDFCVEDFDLPFVDMMTTAESTRRYYQLNLQARNGEGRRIAVRLLNESKVVDQAIGQLFRLHESLGGMTLQDVIQMIRVKLLSQKRELVILVEDFKALTGIQDTLLKVLIQEGNNGGVRNMATMATIRSVIAVTNGYIDGKDTIASRANREWVVKSKLSNDEEVLMWTKALVASYLNAARWGYDELVHRYEQRGSSGVGTGAWIDIFASEEGDKDTDILNAFGRFNGIPLFPYTELAIEQLARTTLTRNNSMVFTPRFIIDNVLRELLLIGRPAFEHRRFPPPAITAPRVNAEVTQWLIGLPVTEEVRDRYTRVIAIWGNLPHAPSDIGYIPKAVFDAFNLPQPNIQHKVRQDKPLDQKSLKVTPVKTAKLTADEELKKELENWSQKSEKLNNISANLIRKSIESALNDRIDIQSERCAKAPISASQISIPNAAGEGNMIPSSSISVAGDHTDPTGQLRSELSAVVRYYQFNGAKKNYEGVDDDLVWIENLVDRLMPQALTHIRSTINQRLGILISLLSTNSRILGSVERGRTLNRLSSFLFGEPEIPAPPPIGAPLEYSDWRSFQEMAISVRPELTQLILGYCGSFQGAGKTPYAVDIVRIVDCMVVEVDATALRSLDGLSVELKQKLAEMLERRVKVKASNLLKSSMNIRNRLTEEFGDNFDKQSIFQELRELADQLKSTGVWIEEEIGLTHPAFRILCEDFRKCALKDALDTLRNAEGNEGIDVSLGDAHLISRMGRFDVHSLIIATRFLEMARKVVKVSEKRAKMLEEKYNGVDPQTEAERIQLLFNSLTEEIASIGVEGDVACS